MDSLIWIKAVGDTLKHHMDIVAEIIDGGISAATEVEIFNDIPLVGTGIKILQARDTFMEERFRRNCIALLDACKRVDAKERASTMDKLCADEKCFEDFADTLLLIATDSTKPFKASIVGKLLAAMMQGQLDYKTYDDLVHIVHLASLPALKALKTFFERTQGSPYLQNGRPTEEPLLLSMGVAARDGSKLTISDQGVLLNKFGLMAL
ncbi:hypothetical protein [Pseudomonas corrugata]|uniref:hypothetical protein n=1 Tax=Pseudomonas corrugata TaxID=47879 RepID=UPI0028C47A65|nr:hypothetical protein [Pseudomonas corrugata]MDU9024448.1 hypothetical protein [Pseudomonas corrugata]